MASSSLKETIQQVIIDHLTAGTMKGVETIDSFMDHIADTFTGIGTGPGEFMRSKDRFREITIEERKEMTYDVSFDMHTMYVRSLAPSIALAEGAFRISIDMIEHVHMLPVRFSMVLDDHSGRWLIVHSHYSVPDFRMEEGGTLMDSLQVRNAELEEEVALRTDELNQSLHELKAAQAQLVHQEKMASLGALTAGIAHEIKNPLNFITNFAQLSADLADDLREGLAEGQDVTEVLADLKHNAQAINKHGQRADAIVRNMMRHASGKTGEPVDIDVHSLLDEYIKLALNGKKAQNPGFSCTIERKYAPSIPTIKAIPGELGRVFLNILSNAFDALKDQDQALVRVVTQLAHQAILIQFMDNGPGIPLDTRDKIFEPFFTTKPAGEGTGLGLSLSYEIITYGHRGMLDVGHSELGGALFTIQLPL